MTKDEISRQFIALCDEISAHDNSYSRAWEDAVKAAGGAYGGAFYLMEPFYARQRELAARRRELAAAMAKETNSTDVEGTELAMLAAIVEAKCRKALEAK